MKKTKLDPANFLRILLASPFTLSFLLEESVQKKPATQKRDLEVLKYFFCGELEGEVLPLTKKNEKYYKEKFGIGVTRLLAIYKTQKTRLDMFVEFLSETYERDLQNKEQISELKRQVLILSGNSELEITTEDDGVSPSLLKTLKKVKRNLTGDVKVKKVFLKDIAEIWEAIKNKEKPNGKKYFAVKKFLRDELVEFIAKNNLM